MMQAFDFDSAPPEFQEVRWAVNLMIVGSAIGWLVNYLSTIFRVFQDRSCGLSLAATCNNIAWELQFVLFYSPGLPLATLVLTLWLLFNFIVLYAAVRFYPTTAADHPSSSLKRRYLSVWVALSILGFLSGHLALSRTLDPSRAFYWAGMLCQVVFSAASLGKLIDRGNTRGASYTMWLSRFIASSFAVGNLSLRAIYWPQLHSFVNNPLMMWSVAAFVILDVLYGICFWYIRRSEENPGLRSKQT